MGVLSCLPIHRRRAAGCGSRRVARLALLVSQMRGAGHLNLLGCALRTSLEPPPARCRAARPRLGRISPESPTSTTTAVGLDAHAAGATRWPLRLLPGRDVGALGLLRHEGDAGSIMTSRRSHRLRWLPAAGYLRRPRLRAALARRHARGSLAGHAQGRGVRRTAAGARSARHGLRRAPARGLREGHAVRDAFASRSWTWHSR